MSFIERDSLTRLRRLKIVVKICPWGQGFVKDLSIYSLTPQQPWKMLVETHITSGDRVQTFSWRYPLPGWNFSICYPLHLWRWQLLSKRRLQLKFSCRYWTSFWNFQKVVFPHEIFHSSSEDSHETLSKKSPLPFCCWLPATVSDNFWDTFFYEWRGPSPTYVDIKLNL